MELYEHQKRFLKKNPNKSALIWSCGIGKTRTAIEWGNKGDGVPLVICPKALKTNWMIEATKWGVITDVITKEEFRKSWKELPKYSQIIVDEVHNGFLTPNFKSQMSKSLRAYLKKHQVPRVLLLSATPYCSSPWNIYSLAHFLGHYWNWRIFSDMFFDRVWMGRRQIPVVKKDINEKLSFLVQQIADVVNINDVLDVPLQNHLEPEYFSLSKGQIQAIKDNYDPLPIVRYTMQHEIENGILIGNEFKESQIYETDKEERIKDLCEENKKIAIVCRYNKQIDNLKHILSVSSERSVYVIRGDVKDRHEVCRKAEEAEEAIVLIQADCAEGYQLPSFPLCIFASQSYSYTKWEQICGRFLRMDKPSRTTFIYLLTDGNSIDQAVYDAIKRKEDFKIELYERKRLSN